MKLCKIDYAVIFDFIICLHQTFFSKLGCQAYYANAHMFEFLSII